ncbi:MAG: gluconate 2-dehydrogenase subunit 3 family protein [Gammaproteobacteria bacterium]|nr:gluconate 2-dehydrogenase subunit 3 family protein [Gammaproteobacteria bacterium]
MSEDTIATDNPLNASQESALAAIVGAMIPASEEYAVPSAADPIIFADILTLVKRHPEPVVEGLAALDDIAESRHGGPFSALGDEDKAAAIAAFSQSGNQHLRAIVSMTAQCYYRDDRVMASLGMEPRPPFPKGFEVEQGDLSLLDPVRARGRIWREA